ncbi:hypothetical protein ABT158_22675 [Nonomuraea sp. NPDC001636]|uniref:hypothetical protein n=1 Tax=Nonomuraea sp. NPDC001636 TaxID=3154391 RepID=UPI00331D9011
MSTGSKITGYRLADVRPYGPTGDDLEVTPLPGLFDSRPETLAAVMGSDVVVVELRRGGLSSADPAGRPLPNWWHVVCDGSHVELPCTTWRSAVRTRERIQRHDECCLDHRVITRHPDVIALFR